MADEVGVTDKRQLCLNYNRTELQSVVVTHEAELASQAWTPKALGSYYTDSQIADFLVWWAVRDAKDSVLDPSFGGGVFLRSAGKRLQQLRGDPKRQIFGIELNADVHVTISELLRHEFGIVPANLIQSDFFEILPNRLRPVDVVVGNPPFIRYQRFSGDARELARKRAAEEGLTISGLSSSWLPFLIHSVRLLRPGGRLAMVIPFEISHATYARPVLDHLSKRFDSVTFLTFRKKLFPTLSEDTLLLLAEGRHEPFGVAQFFLRDLAHAGELPDIKQSNRRRLSGVRRLNTEGMATGSERLIESLIPSRACRLYRELRHDGMTLKLGELADVGIGYVTGANGFFHLSPEKAREWKIPERFLRPCLRRGRSLSGLRLTQRDWQRMLPSGQAGYLLELPGKGDLPDAVNQYLSRGKREGVDKTFKCRTRSPWYRVPHVYQPDAFLTYMSGDTPRLVANDAGVVAPNTLHILRIHEGIEVPNNIVAMLWRTSLTHLSVEIEGHALGGGMLKLEPGEAEQVLLPTLTNARCYERLPMELDKIAREQGDDVCTMHADRELLQGMLGLSAADVDLLRTSAQALRERRTSRSSDNERG